MKNKLIIFDTSCLIALTRIDKLNVLQKLFSTVLITPEVEMEYAQPFPSWIIVKPVKDQAKLREFRSRLGLGEASAIALALETANCLLLIDERRGRNLASLLSLSIVGTLRVILLAKQKNILPSVKIVLDELEVNGF